MKGIYLQIINFLLWWYEQDQYFVNSTHHNAYRNLLFKVIHWCIRTVCSKFIHAVQSYPKCWGNFGQQYLSFWYILNFMPYNFNMENIIIHNKTRDMLPSISSTILHMRYSEHANSKSVQSSPIWRYWPFVRGIHRSPVNSSHKGQWRHRNGHSISHPYGRAIGPRTVDKNYHDLSRALCGQATGLDA